jgi:histidine transport system permease protein/arginine/ornithine transport system permease protein
MEDVVAYMPLVLEGFWVTIFLSVTSLGVSVLIGIFGALASLSGPIFLRRVVGVYVMLVRGIPDLVLMLLLFFGGQKLLNDVGYWLGLWDYVDLSKFTVGILTIGFIFGAYMTETFRGGLLAIDRGQVESARAVGMGRVILFRRVIWPQLVFYSLPSFSNNWMVLMKTTALVSVIGLNDVVYNSFVAGRAVRDTFTFLFVAMVFYLILSALSDGAFALVNRYYCAWSTSGERR